MALPWAIGAALVRPGEKVISVSGDGSFMQSSMELETAVRLKSNIVHIIWVDNGYNMVAMQEQQKYCRTSGVSFGPIDFKRYAESFGAAGFAVRSADELRATLRAALAVEGPACGGHSGGLLRQPGADGPAQARSIGIVWAAVLA